MRTNPSALQSAQGKIGFNILVLLALGLPGEVTREQILTALCTVELDHTPITHVEIGGQSGVCLKVDLVISGIERRGIEVLGAQWRTTLNR